MLLELIQKYKFAIVAILGGVIMVSGGVDYYLYRHFSGIANAPTPAASSVAKIDYPQAPPRAQGADCQPNTAIPVRSVSGMSLFSDKSQSSKLVATIPNGASVLLGCSDGTWFNAAYNGQNGYVAAHDVTQSKSAAPGLAGAPPPSTSVSFVDPSPYLSQLSSASSTGAAESVLQSFLNNYQMSFSLHPTTIASVYTFTPVTNQLSQVKSYGALFIQEWSKYPTNWLHGQLFSNNPHIAFVADLRINGTQISGGYDGNTTIAYNLQSLGWFTNLPHNDFVRGMIHHEAAHYAEATSFGSILHSDPTWDSYNPAGFQYSSSGEASGGYVQHPRAGFVTSYAETDIAEDKAELFSYLMTDDYSHTLKGWIQSDPNLRNKVGYYKQVVCQHWSTMCGSYFDTTNP